MYLPLGVISCLCMFWSWFDYSRVFGLELQVLVAYLLLLDFVGFLYCLCCWCLCLIFFGFGFGIDY